jgi:branched-chain amino acid transport system ATP-binding protein
MLLELADVRGGYGGADILHGVSLEVGEREIVTIAGTNGAGKSTLAKAVVGLLPRAGIARRRRSRGPRGRGPDRRRPRLRSQVANVFHR